MEGNFDFEVSCNDEDASMRKVKNRLKGRRHKPLRIPIDNTLYICHQIKILYGSEDWPLGNNKEEYLLDCG